MTPGQIIKSIIKSRGLTNAEVARQAGIERMYVTNITQDVLKGKEKYNAVLRVLDVPHEVIIFKSLDIEKIANPAQKRLMEKLYAGMISEIDLVFNCKTD